MKTATSQARTRGVTAGRPRGERTVRVRDEDLRITATRSVGDRGSVRYAVDGPRLTGTFLVIPEWTYDGPVIPDTVRVQFGDGPEGCGWYGGREGEPVVNGVRIHGWSGSISVPVLPGRYDLHTYAVAVGPGGVHRRIPEGAERRLSALVDTLLRIWLARADRADLLEAAAAWPTARRLQHERTNASELRGELQRLRSEQDAARALVNRITGVMRRRPAAVRETDGREARLALTDGRGRALGSCAVRERSVNELPGTVVYEVHGARVHGSFTVGPGRYGTTAVPGGLHVAYGRSTALHFGPVQDQPTVNGVSLSGGWNSASAEAVTASSPDHLPASVSTGTLTFTSAPAATVRRASAVLRALALHFLARPDLPALRLAAAKAQAASSLAAARADVRRLRTSLAQVRRELAWREQRIAHLQALTGAATPFASRSHPAVEAETKTEEMAVCGVRQLVKPTTSELPARPRADAYRAA